MKREIFFVYHDADSEPTPTDEYDEIEIGRFLNMPDKRGNQSARMPVTGRPRVRTGSVLVVREDLTVCDVGECVGEVVRVDRRRVRADQPGQALGVLAGEEPVAGLVVGES
jgi:hypothetical protein